jgi:hypothetical protein
LGRVSYGGVGHHVDQECIIWWGGYHLAGYHVDQEYHLAR